jgi:hypothetical protein
MSELDSGRAQRRDTVLARSEHGAFQTSRLSPPKTPAKLMLRHVKLWRNFGAASTRIAIGCTVLSIFAPFIWQYILVLIAATTSILAILLWRAYGKKRQNILVFAANNIVRELCSEQAPSTSDDFVLFLRPIFITGEISVLRRGAHWRAMEYLFSPRWLAQGYKRRRDVEWFIADALEPNYFVISIGGEALEFGVARHHTSSDTWKQKFKYLSAAARAIILIPADQAGTFWEMEQIIGSDLIQKTIILMPPDESVSRVKSMTFSDHDNEEYERALTANLFKHGIIGLEILNTAKDEGVSLAQCENTRYSDIWKSAISMCSKIGLALPSYRKNGGLCQAGVCEPRELGPLNKKTLKRMVSNVVTLSTVD